MDDVRGAYRAAILKSQLLCHIELRGLPGIISGWCEMAKKGAGAENSLELLDLVVTITEAGQRWHYSESTVRRWADEGKVAARKSGGTWLIDVASLRARVDRRKSGESR